MVAVVGALVVVRKVEEPERAWANALRHWEGGRSSITQDGYELVLPRRNITVSEDGSTERHVILCLVKSEGGSEHIGGVILRDDSAGQGNSVQVHFEVWESWASECEVDYNFLYDELRGLFAEVDVTVALKAWDA